MSDSPPFDLLIFDLDGTLAETRQGIAQSIGHALGELGREPLELETVVRYVGDGARVLVERSLGHEGAAFESEDVDRGLELFVDHYNATGLHDSELYPGVRETLDALAETHALAVLTNKPESATERILDVLGISELFLAAIGGDGALPRKPDPSGLQAIVEKAGASAERTLLVGDTHVDVHTARAASCPVAGVLYGFRPRDFDAAPPDWRLKSFSELLEICRR